VIAAWVASGAPAMKTTLPSDFATGVTIANVLVSAFVDASVHVETPLALPMEQDDTVLADPVALKVGVWFGTGLFPESRSVTVTVLVATPSARIDVVPVIVEVAADGAPAMKVTFPSALLMGAVIERVLTSATVEVRVQLETPLAFVTEQIDALLPVPLALKTGVCPGAGLFAASRSVMVMFDVETPSASVGEVPIMLEFAAATGPGWNTTMPPFTNIGDVRRSVFDSAVVDVRSQRDIPVVTLIVQAP